MRQLQFHKALGRAPYDAHIVDKSAVGLGLVDGIDRARAKQNHQQEEGLKTKFQHVLHICADPGKIFMVPYAITELLLR